VGGSKGKIAVDIRIRDALIFLPILIGDCTAAICIRRARANSLPEQSRSGL
jgi:hypothetical protein